MSADDKTVKSGELILTNEMIQRGMDVVGATANGAHQPHTVYLTPAEAERWGRYYEQGGIKVVTRKLTPTTRHDAAKETE